MTALRRNELAALTLVLLAGGASLFGCASIVGADFDRPEDDAVDDGGTDDGGSGSTTTAGDASQSSDGGKRDASTGSSADASTTSPGGGTDASGDASTGGSTDASTDASSHLDGAVDAGDSGHTVDCSGKTSPAKGDLVVTEMLIETQLDQLDDPGQWIEITNVSGCPLPLAGLQIVSPNSHRSQDDEVDISATDTTVVPNLGTFVVANVAAPSNIGGTIYSWGANGTLEAGEDSVSIYLQGVTISSIEEQWADCASNETPCYNRGQSIELPSQCAPSDETNTWKPSTHAYGTDNGVSADGTPNALNTDQTGCTRF